MSEQNKNIKVLLIEDNPFDAKVVEDLFVSMKDSSFSRRMAGTLQEAQAADALEKADVLLLDLNLPDSFGPETLHKVQKFAKDRPIIVLTGFYEEHLGINMIKKGAQDYLVKGKINANLLAYSIKYAIERARIDAKLQQREARLREVLEKAPDGFLVIGPSGRVLFANRGAEQLLGRSRADLAGLPPDLPSDLERTIETELTRPDGVKVPAEVRAAELQWGEENCRLVMIRDLTAVRLLERNRDEFISRISHDLRAPLTIVREAMGLVADGTAGTVADKQKEILQMGIDSADRINRLIDALLDITKMEAGVMPMYVSETDLGAMLAACAAEHTYLAADRGIEISTRLPAGKAVAYCDADKVREVLANLVFNALKFTPRGGRITLSLETGTEGARLCVENTGQGIAPEDIHKLFHKFAQVSSSGQAKERGTGLGLASCRGIVELHRGRIWAESDYGRNCRFLVQLPLPGFSEAAGFLLRREIDLAGGKGEFCALGVTLPPGLAAAASKVEAFIHSRLRASSRAVVRRGDRSFLVILSKCGGGECARAGTLLEEGIRQVAGVPPESGRLAAALSYPADFSDELEFLRRMPEGWGKDA